jgi:uncharacterized protein involved in type VI secretion and phage assembly
MDYLITHNITLPHIYRAQVVDNVDSQSSGRVLVSIPGVTDTYNSTIWARPSNAFGYSNDYGSHAVPPIGSYIYIFFENADPSFPVYMGGVVLLDSLLPEATQDGQQQNEYIVLRTPNGNIIRISDNKNRILVSTASNYVDINESTKQISITSLNGDILETAQNTVTINGKQGVVINGQTVVITAEGDAILTGSTATITGVAGVTVNGDTTVNGSLMVSTGANGTFTSQTGQKITVQDGIVIDISDS